MDIKGRKSSEQRAAPVKGKAIVEPPDDTKPLPPVNEETAEKTSKRSGWKDHRGEKHYRKSDKPELTPEEIQAKREAAKAERKKKRDEEFANLDIWHNYTIRQWKKELNITLTSEIPPLPTKEEKLEEPSHDELKKQKAELMEKQAATKQKLQDYNDEIRKKKQDNKESNKDQNVSLYDIQKAKKDERGRLLEEKRVIREKLNQVNEKSSNLVTFSLCP
jgi:hypothetical protein